MSRKGLVGLVAIVVLMMLASPVMALNVQKTFHGTNATAVIEWNKTLAVDWAKKFKLPENLTADIENGNWKAEYNVTVFVTDSNNPDVGTGPMPIVIKFYTTNESAHEWEVTAPSYIFIWQYNTTADNGWNEIESSDGVRSEVVNITADGDGNNSATWLVVEAGDSGSITIENNDTPSEKVTIYITVARFNVDSVKIGNSGNLMSSNGMIQAGDWDVYVNVTGYNLNNSTLLNSLGFEHKLELNLTNFSVGVKTASPSVNTSTKTGNIFLNYTISKVAFHKATAWNWGKKGHESYNITGFIKLKGNMSVYFTTWKMNVTAADPYKWKFDTSEMGTGVVGSKSIKLKVELTDKFGNVNYTFAKWYNGTITVTSKTSGVTAWAYPNASVTLNTSAGEYNETKWINVSDLPAEVEVKVSGASLEPANVTLTYYAGFNGLSVDLSRDYIIANNSDVVEMKVQLTYDGTPVKVKDVNITVAEDTTLGLRFSKDKQSWDTSVTNSTDENGVATFYINTSNTKAGTAKIILSANKPGVGSASKSVELEVKPAIHVDHTQATVYPDTLSIVAGKPVNITLTLKDYADKPIKNFENYGYKVLFNITGDACWKVGDKCIKGNYTVDKDVKGNGNASATLYTENATNNNVQVRIYVYNESGKWDLVKDYGSVEVKPNNVSKIAIFYNDKKITSFAYPQGVDKSYKFTIKYLDAYGNVNKSSGTVKIYPETCYVGTFTTTSVSISNGEGSVEFKTNKSAPVGTSCKFIFNDTTFKTGNVTLTIAVSGVEGIYVSFNKSSYNIGETVLVKAQLKGANGIDLAKPGVKVTFVIEGPGYMNVTENVTDENGIAITTFKATKAGVWKVTASNASVSGTNSTTVAGNASKILLVPLSKEISVNTTVTFNITVVDENGYPTMKPKGEVKFIVKKDDVVVNTTTVKLEVGKASFSYNFTEAGNYTVIAWYNETLFNTSNIHVSTVAPTPPTPTTPTPPPTNIEQTIHKYYPSGNVNSKNDVLQAIINAINDYFSAPSDKKTEILNDIIAMINHYFTLS